MRSLGRVVLLAAVVLGATPPSAVDAQATPAGSAASPLTLRATCDARAQTPVLRVQIANTSDRTASVVLGFTAADGQTRVVNSVQVIAIRPATGADESYLYVNPKYALAKGAPWIVSLAPGATHDLELPLRDFISGMTYTSLEPAVVGGTRLMLEAPPAAKETPPVWTGAVETKLEPCRE